MKLRSIQKEYLKKKYSVNFSTERVWDYGTRSPEPTVVMVRDEKTGKELGSFYAWLSQVEFYEFINLEDKK